MLYFLISSAYNFDKPEKLTCVNSGEMNATFEIPFNLRLSVKFSSHIMKSTRAKIFSCTNYFNSMAVLCLRSLVD